MDSSHDLPTGHGSPRIASGSRMCPRSARWLWCGAWMGLHTSDSALGCRRRGRLGTLWLEIHDVFLYIYIYAKYMTYLYVPWAINISFFARGTQQQKNRWGDFWSLRWAMAHVAIHQWRSGLTPLEPCRWIWPFCAGWWFGCHQFYFPIYWVANHPKWLSYFSEGWPNHQPVVYLI